MTRLNYQQVADLCFKLFQRKPIIIGEAFLMSVSICLESYNICICENKDANQLPGNRAADQCLCFCYIQSTIPLLQNAKFQVFSHLLWLHSLVCVGPGRKP